MTQRTDLDPLFSCGNCLNWGRVWRYLKKARVCSREKDLDGVLRTETSMACKYFVPIQGTLPIDVQRLRLFAQSLGNKEAAYLEWALQQRKLITGLQDAQRNDLHLGDHVYFRHEIDGYYGTIEGVEHDNKQAVIVNTPAFGNATISLPASSVRVLTKGELNEIVKTSISAETKKSIDWQISALESEISSMREKGLDNFTYDERARLLFLEGELKNKNSIARYYNSFL